ncbi:MAG: glutathione S-transferase family protein [Pseudomonadota bacterium]|nr:glutathione S-transferase family protein [Pseudomonadota bacterium]
MLILYDGTTSVCAVKVRLVLSEKALNFESRTLDLRKGQQFSPEYTSLNPGAVVPTLIDSATGTDEIIIESSVIMQYLDDLAPDPPLLPDSPRARAQVRLWLKRIDDPVHPSTGILTHATAFRASFLAKTPQEQKNHLNKIPDPHRRARQKAVYRDGLAAPLVADAVRVFDKLLADMESTLNNQDFLAGRAYSLADAAATPYVNRLRDLGLLPVWAKKCPRISDWFARIEARASFKEAITDYFTDKDADQFAGVDEAAPALALEIITRS